MIGYALNRSTCVQEPICDQLKYRTSGIEIWNFEPGRTRQPKRGNKSGGQSRQSLACHETLNLRRYASYPVYPGTAQNAQILGKMKFDWFDVERKRIEPRSTFLWLETTVRTTRTRVIWFDLMKTRARAPLHPTERSRI